MNHVLLKLPNLFLIGAPKSGTTSLARYLSDHPNVFMSYPKEPHHYNTDIHHITDINDRADYLALFRGVGPEHRIVAEASVRYLYSKDAVPRILKDRPRAQFIVMLRNPVDMAYSLHDHMVFAGKETEPDFIEAWHLQEERRSGRSVPATCEDVKLILYREACAIGEQLGSLFELVPRDRVLLIFFDDLVVDPRGVWCDVLSFLNLPDDNRTDFPVMNAAKTVRSEAAERIIRKIRNVKRLLRLGPRFSHLLRPLSQLNIKKRRREPLPLAARQEILDAFLVEIEQVEALTGRDLTGWKTIRSNQ